MTINPDNLPPAPEPKPWLPSESTTGSGPKRLIPTITVAALLLIAANLVAGRIVAKFNTTQMVIDTKWSLVDSNELKGDGWLILGDSAGNQGLNPEVLADKLGGVFLNLCTIGDMLTLDDAWMLDRWIENEGPPRGVIVVHAYDTWARSPKGTVFALIPGGPPPNATPTLSLPPKERLKYLVVKYAPLLTSNQTIRQIILNPRESLHTLTKEHTSTQDTQSDPTKNSMSTLGFLSVPAANPENVRTDAHAHISSIQEQRSPEMSSANAAGLKVIVDRCKSLGVPLLFVHAPTAQSLAQSTVYIEHFQKVNAQLAKHLAELGWGEIAFTNPVVFPDDQMQNADHLITGSAKIFSQMVADRFHEYLHREPSPNNPTDPAPTPQP